MSELPPFDPYHVLGIDRTADSAIIKKAYRKLALAKHPDKCTDEALKDRRTDEFQRLNEAYDILGDDEKRKRHDALVKLEALRKERASMGGPPRPFTRSATFQNGYPGATAYTSRGATNVEDRVPKGFYEDEDRYNRRPYGEYDSTRRPASGTARAERTRAERDDERRRSERRRDEQVRDARSRKYEDMDRYPDRESKREAPSREKYDGWEDDYNMYTNRAPPPTRPGMTRRTSTREAPRNIYTTRSRAAARETKSAREDREILEKERELLKEQERLARLQRQEAERERQAREDRERLAREAEKLARQEEREREQERRRAQEERERRALEREAARERESRPRRKENVEPYDRRPPQLQHNHSSPPAFVEGMLPRVRTDPVTSDSVPYPHPSRSNTMPSVPLSTSSARRTTGQSKLRETGQPDSGYSSNSTNNSEQRTSRTTAKPVKITNLYYNGEGKPYKVETHEPGSTSSRRRSPSVERPTMERASQKMANLAKHAVRPGTSSGAYGTTSYPLRTRSPERSTRHERDYTSRSSRPLYGQRTPSFDPNNVSYTKPITRDDISYTRTGSSRREKDAYGYSPSQGFDRRGTMPIPPMQ